MNNLIKIRRDLHQKAETSFKEWQTLEYIINFVKDTKATCEFLPLSLFDEFKELTEVNEDIHTFLDTDVNLPFVKVTFNLNKEGKHLAFRSDIDGLPIKESQNIEHRPYKENFVSLNNNSHACGHDGHMALSLSLIDYIDKNFDTIVDKSPFAKISFIFQAAEEGCRGASILLKSNFLDDIDVLYCYHLALGLKTDYIAPCPKNFLATFKFYLESYGKKAHAAKPYDGISALYYITKSINHLMDIQDVQKGLYVNFGSLECVGESNIISDFAKAKGEIRALNKKSLYALKEKLISTLDNIYKDNEKGYKLIKRGEAFDIVHSENLVNIIAKVSSYHNLITDFDYCFNASEDASLLIDKVQAKGKSAIYFVIGANIASPHHTSTFDFDEKALINGFTILQSLIFESID